MSSRYEEDDNERLFAFQRLLDGSRHASDPVVNLKTLRKLCEKGIPNHPPHLRPLAYSLLLETLPPEKRLWRPTSKQQRDKYYNLVKTFMEELESQPSSSSSTHDKLLLDLSKDLKSLKSTFWRTRTSPNKSSPFRPLQNPQSPTDDKVQEPTERDSSDDEESDGSVYPEPILSRRALFKRIDLLNEIEHKGGFGHAANQKGKQRETTNTRILESDKYDKRSQSGEDEASQGQPEEGKEEEQIMSPKITLSVDPSPSQPILSRLDTIKPTLIDTSSTSSLGPNSMIVPDTEDKTNTPTSPITLLSPKPLPSGSASPSPFSGSLYYPETNSECLARLIYVFLRINPQWTYQPSFVDIISTFYLIHAGGGGSANSQRILDYPEESTFWFIITFFQEFDTVLLTSEVAVDQLSKRLYWINPPLYTKLVIEKGIDLKMFAFRWFSHLFLKDLPLSNIPKLYDFLLTEEDSTPNNQPKADLAIDIALSMILLVKDILLEKPRAKGPAGKPNGLWGVEDVYMDDEEDQQESLMRCLKVLREYPLRHVGGISAVLDMAAQLRKIRLDAERNGENIATSPPPSRKVENVQAKSKDSGSVGSSAILKASSSWSKAIGSFWGSNSKAIGENPDVSLSQNKNSQDREEAVLRNDGSDSQHRDGQPTSKSSLVQARERSDTLDSTTSSIQERLSNLTASTPPTRIKSASSPSSLPRPLLLSSSISTRRSSGSSLTGLPRFHGPGTNGHSSRRDSSSSLASSSNLSSPVKRQSPPLHNGNGGENGVLSPPTSLRSPPPTGLYRIGSRQRSRSSLGDQALPPGVGVDAVKRDLKYGEGDTPSRSTTPRPTSLTLSDYYKSENGDEHHVE
ncbi:uncharacterized protein I303_100244 [Kwoniella dejecticola CBS 10117]|uniref:Rab-GAP TBC domain-containing protein n=1 Tax=Kwoniella dejecticola CBS 10117 TaxID=1296121 RepID=A0A1A6AEF8_9TREE|nr:uncharacterized protein I303_00246 [Kwoniella dejecticola CBS 10117]OBR88429.1 hypothetical protein I303_00246 [Kwoniella dejecticola CBS 10117]